MRRRLWLLLAVTSLWLAGCSSTSSAPRDEVDDIIHVLAADYKKRDADHYLSYFSKHLTVCDGLGLLGEVVGVPGQGTEVTRARGDLDHAAFSALIRETFAGLQSVERAKYVLIDIEAGEDDDWAVESLFRLWATEQDGTRRYEEATLRWAFAEDEDEKLRIRSLRFCDRTVVRSSHRDYVERAKEVGLDVKHEVAVPYPPDVPLIAENFIGSGAAAGDVDGDGRIDLLLGDGQRCRLFRNAGPGKFEDVSAGSGIDAVGKVRGAYLVDVDDDGRLDAFLTRVEQPPVCLLNRGDLRFEDASERLGLSALPAMQYTSAAFADVDGDGDLDAYLCVYGDFDEVSFASPLYDADDGPPHVVLKNEGGRFTRVETPPFDTRGWGLAVSFGDMDDDGDQDIYAVNDFGVNHLYRNDGAWKFTDVTEAAGVTDQGFGMSSHFGDYDGDGKLDIFVANVFSSSRWVFDDPNFPLPIIADLFFLRDDIRAEVYKVLRGNSLYRNLGGGKFEQVASKVGVERGEWAWGATFFDGDNDGDQDIYLPNGYITGPDPPDQ